MTISKAWNWEQEKGSIWREPSEEAYYIAHRWKERGYRDVLDFGCGLGRHAIFFAKQGFQVSAFDLSEVAVSSLKAWAAKELLCIEAITCDMLNLPYEDGCFDAVFAYHVISHTDTNGMVQILSELHRILRPGGEVFLTLCSKDAWSYREAGFPRIDENTVLKTEDGPEKDIPHFFVSMGDILKLFDCYKLQSVRHIDDCYFAGKNMRGRHYFILAERAVGKMVSMGMGLAAMGKNL